MDIAPIEIPKLPLDLLRVQRELQEQIRAVCAVPPLVAREPRTWPGR